MTYEEIKGELKALGNEKWRQIYSKFGEGEDHYGVKMGDLRVLAKKIKPDQDLAAKLWDCGNVDAMLLSTLIVKPKSLSLIDLEQMVGKITYSHVADWFGSYVLKLHPDREFLRTKWMDSKHEWTARMGWSLTAERVVKSPEGLDLKGLLDRLETEMGQAPANVQWTMNYVLAEIGINNPDLRPRAIQIGEKIGAFRDYPVSKGCTSPYAPIWIAEMVKRQN